LGDMGPQLLETESGLMSQGSLSPPSLVCVLWESSRRLRPQAYTCQRLLERMAMKDKWERKCKWTGKESGLNLV
jgi:hypothetical protein